MNPKHTPGPWVYDEEDGVVLSCKNTDIVCDLPFIDDGCAADGRLIAAAPEMLAALVNVTARLAHLASLCDNCDPGYLANAYAECGAADVAIAKATGEGGAA